MGIKLPDRKLLWGRSHNQCAYPTCVQALTETLPNADDSKVGEIVVGEEAHIRSKSLDGPRHDPEYDEDRLDSYENYILLCPTHHTMIDKEDGRGFSADDLVRMRDRHERQLEKSQRLERTIRSFLAYQYDIDDKVRFEAVDINGLALDSLFIDVPMARRTPRQDAGFLATLQQEKPGDLASLRLPLDFVVTGAAQALLHPEWRGNAILVGGPGQGKSTLLQFLCQYHRARFLGRDDYSGIAQGLSPVTTTHRIAIRIDLKLYATRSRPRAIEKKRRYPAGKRANDHHQHGAPVTIEQYIAEQIHQHSGGQQFGIKQLATLLATRPMLLALDGLDEVANLEDRERVAEAIADTAARLEETAGDVIIIVASRPGLTGGRLWTSKSFPIYTVQPLTPGLRIQYLQAWAQQASIGDDRTARLQAVLLEHEALPHIRELASNPMQLAILLHLLHRRQLLPQQRTELYDNYIETFFDREDDKEPLVQTERKIVEDIHAYLGWHLHCQTELGATSGSISKINMKTLLDHYLRDHEKGRELAGRLFDAFTTRVICLVINESDDVEFEVQSLREYFAARFIEDHAPVRGKAKNTRDDCINAVLERPYWSNVLRFLIGMLSKGEIRAIPSNLRHLDQQRGLAGLPMARWISSQLLDDRVFGALESGPVQDMVDFALDGVGVVFGEDGLLDASGTPVRFSQGAGRAQATTHLQHRLMIEDSPALRTLIATALRRHTTPAQLREWWWNAETRKASATWLKTAADLGVLIHLTPNEASHLAACAQDLATSPDLFTELVSSARCDSDLDGVLRPCLQEIGDGVDPRLMTAPLSGTPLSRLLHAAKAATRGDSAEVAQGGTEQMPAPGRRRKGSTASLLAVLETAAVDVWSARNDWNDDGVWARAMDKTQEIWGDSWILRHAVLRLPDTVGIREAQPTTSVGATWRQLAAWVRCAVQHRDDSDWWSAELPTDLRSLAGRLWACALLAYARGTVVAAKSSDLDSTLNLLTPHQFAVMEDCLARLTLQGGRRLSLKDDLRLGRLSLSPRSAILVHVVAHDSTREQLTKHVMPGLPELLRDGLTDLAAVRELPNATINITDLHGLRARRLDSLLQTSRLAGMTDKQAREILNAPHEWPSVLVQTAAQRMTQKAATSRGPLITIAEKDAWFPDVSWRASM